MASPIAFDIVLELGGLGGVLRGSIGGYLCGRMQSSRHQATLLPLYTDPILPVQSGGPGAARPGDRMTSIASRSISDIIIDCIGH